MSDKNYFYIYTLVFKFKIPPKERTYKILNFIKIGLKSEIILTESHFYKFHRKNSMS